MLEYFTYFFSFQSCRKLDKNAVFLPSYHTVSDQYLPHIRPLYPYKSIAQFEREMDFILKRYKPLTFNELISYTSSTPAFHLNFDDGLAECYNVVLPVLLQKGIPATFFINNDFVDNKALFYRFKTALIIDRIQQGVQYLRRIASYLQVKPDLVLVRQKLLGMDQRFTQDLEQMGTAIDLDFEAFLQYQKPYLNTDQINDMVAKGFTIGAHSRSHPHYDSLTLEEQLQETTASLQGLQKDFGLDYAAFAFPFSDSKISKEFVDQIKRLIPAIQLFGIKGIRPHEHGYYNRYIMELHTQKSPSLALKYLYLKSIIK